MELYSEGKDYKLYHGNMLDMLEVIEPNSIDSIITDPPYGLTSITKRFGKEDSAPTQYGRDGSFARLSKGFMGKEWDGSGIETNVEAWKKCYEVLKPGGFLLAFGGDRTIHRIACAIEDAGFIIKNTLMYLYGTGFPKGLNVGLAIDKMNGVESKVVGFGKSGTTSRAFQSEELTTAGSYEMKQAQNIWGGYNTALKPAFEPIIVAQKPVEKSVVYNIMKYGVGAYNIDECRIGNELIKGGTMPKMNDGEQGVCNFNTIGADRLEREDTLGRYPSNVIHDGSDEVIKDMPNTKSGTDISFGSVRKAQEDNLYKLGFTQKENDTQYAPDNYGDEGSASRYFKECKFSEKDDLYDFPFSYFYGAKASKEDRDEGLGDDFEEKECTSALNTKNGSGERLDGGATPVRKNIHPTVKNCQLMQYLVRLVSPKGATILDCFNGSGSTGKAVMFENKERNANYKYIGIELTDEYLPISKARIEYVINNDFDFWKDENGKTQHEVVKKNKNQMSIFDFEVE